MSEKQVLSPSGKAISTFSTCKSYAFVRGPLYTPRTRAHAMHMHESTMCVLQCSFYVELLIIIIMDISKRSCSNERVRSRPTVRSLRLHVTYMQGRQVVVRIMSLGTHLTIWDTKA